MSDILSAAEFLPAHLHLVAGFDCGTEMWQLAQADWIKNPPTRKFSTATHDTDIWLYYRSDGSLVGFGSLGTAQWSNPYPDGPRTLLALIPSLALQRPYWGKPKNDPPKYSHQILADLVGKAVLLGPSLLGLRVHEDNKAAIALYKSFRFVDVPNSKDRGYVRMVLRLR
jgi:hypothetical protein